MLKRLAEFIGGRPGDGPPGTLVAVFGKHPGWNDHMQELGLDSAGLVDLRRDLYTEGVGRNIDLGTWDALPEGDRIPAFAHVFLRVRGDLVAGRLWSSSDGRGRSLYPMVLAVQCAGIGPGAAARVLAEPMRSARDQLRAATDAADVRTVHGGLNAIMREAVARGRSASDPAGAAFRALARREDLGPDGEGLLRVMYELERELGPFGGDAAGAGRRRAGTGTRAGEARGSMHRVPRGAEDPESGVAVWYDLLSAWDIRDRGVLLAAHDEMPWVDIVIGPPTATRLACLRAGTTRIPLSSSVPFSMDDSFRSRMAARIAEARGS